VIDLCQVVFLALVQGLTEFLPISSSAHLVIPPLLLGWPDQGLAFDVAVHVGTLLAVVIYYRHDLLNMASAWLRSLGGAPANDDSAMVWYLLIATIPAGVVGLAAGDYIESHLRNLPVIASTTLVFGLLLGLSQKLGAPPGEGRRLSVSLAAAIGLAQALAPVPGVSRSGVTITAALMLGMDRQGAARFSFLLSIPIIASAGVLKTVQLAAGSAAVNWVQLMIGVGVSAITAYLCIALFLRWIDRVGLMPFVYYRVLLALVLYGIWLAR
jgi:undecaprenyl-diphosphatase